MSVHQLGDIMNHGHGDPFCKILLLLFSFIVLPSSCSLPKSQPAVIHSSSDFPPQASLTHAQLRLSVSNL